MDEIIKTDLVISLGGACRPAHYLRENKLRKFSNPLDWMMMYSLESVLNLFKKDFSDFFLHRREHPQDFKRDYRYIEDTVNGIISIHSFPICKNPDDFYKEFIQTMSYRYSRLKKTMLSAENILFVSNRVEPIENFEKFLTEMKKMFDCRMTFLNIRYDLPKPANKIFVARDIEIIEHYFIDAHPDGDDFSNPKFWLGNGEEWNKVMKTIELTDRFTHDNNVIVTEDSALK